MRITYDTATGAFAFDGSTVRPFGASIEARLDRHGQVVHFDGLEFGVTITRNDGVPETHTFPPPGVTYRSTDQDVLTALPVTWRPDDAITIDVWITNGGVTMTGQHSLTAPRPAQPYPSWSWGGARWAAPVAYPDDGGWYEWDEAAQAWVINVNDADAATLQLLDGVAEALAADIITAREAGPFTSLDDLADRVDGIGPATIDGWAGVAVV